MLGCVVLAPVCLHLYLIFLSCVAFIFRSVSLSVYRVSFCLSGLCMYECESARVFCVCVCIHNSVSVDLPVGIPLPFNSCRAGMLNLPLPWTSPPLPCSLHLLLPSSHCFCPPQCLHFATTLLQIWIWTLLVVFLFFKDCFHIIDNASQIDNDSRYYYIQRTVHKSINVKWKCKMIKKTGSKNNKNVISVKGRDKRLVFYLAKQI